jgi:hypothetical protein
MQCYSWCLDKNHVMPVAQKKLGGFFLLLWLFVCLFPKPVLVRGLIV